MPRLLIGTLCLSLLFLSGCREEPVKAPNESEIRTIKAIDIKKGDSIGEQDTIQITGSITEKSRYKKYSSVDLRISFSILSYQEDLLFQPEKEIHTNIQREKNKIFLKNEEIEEENNTPSLEIFQKDDGGDSSKFIQENFLKGKDKKCELQLQETFQNNKDNKIYQKRNILYKNIERLSICDSEFCTANMFCGPYADKETKSYFLSTETGNTIVFFNAGEDRIIGREKNIPREETIQIK